MKVPNSRRLAGPLVALACATLVVTGAVSSPASAAAFVQVNAFAGTGVSGSTGDGGPATAARFQDTTNVRFDRQGNLYVADCNANRVRKVGTNGIISTFAGTGAAASTGNNGPATSAALNCPSGIAFDSKGNAYIAEYAGHRVRKVTPGGTISAFAGTGIEGNTPSGNLALNANMRWPWAVAVGPDDSVYISDNDSSNVKRVGASGTLDIFAGSGPGGYGSSGDGGPAVNAYLGWVNAITVDPQGNVFISDMANGIRKVNTSGTITKVAGNGSTTYSGDGGQALSAGMTASDVAFDGQGNMFIADVNRVRKVAASGVITTIAGTGVAGTTGDGGDALSGQIRAGTLAYRTGELLVGDYYSTVVRRLSLHADSSTAVVNASVDPTMSFTVASRSTACNGATPTAGSSSTATAVNLGNINSAASVIAAQDLTASTNAQTGMSIMGRYSGAINDGKGNTIPSLNETSYATAAAFPASGTPAFGFLTGWYSPGIWSGFTTTGIDTFLSRYTPGDSNTCIAYRAQAGLATPAGSYSTTVIYTAVARF